MDEVLLERSGVNFFGFETVDNAGKRRRDVSVVRGNGDLSLTPEELHFRRLAPPIEVSVPIDLIEWVGTAKAHNGKSFGFLPILQVAFRTATETRIVGVCVGRQAETHEWVTALEDLLAARSREEVR